MYRLIGIDGNEIDVPHGDYFLPTRCTTETLTIGKGTFFICSVFSNQGTIVDRLANQMLADVRDGIADQKIGKPDGQP